MTESKNLAKAIKQGRDSARPVIKEIALNSLKTYQQPSDQPAWPYSLASLLPMSYQTIGKRNEQQDTFGIAETYHRNADKISPFLSNMFDTIQDEARKKKVPDGATANVAYISHDQTITVANAGNARTILFVLDTKTGKVEPIRLSYDNIITDTEELVRINKAGGMLETDPESGRVSIRSSQGKLKSIARGLGDLDYPGVTHIPDITQINVSDLIKHDSGKEVFVVQTTGGAYENGWHEQDLAKVLEQHFNPGLLEDAPAKSGWSFKKKTQAELIRKPITREFIQEKERDLVQIIAAAAIEAGSTDNITVNAVRLSHFQLKDLVMGVFDGYGGAETAKLATNIMQSKAIELDGNLIHPSQTPSGKINIRAADILREDDSASVPAPEVTRHLHNNDKINHAGQRGIVPNGPLLPLSVSRALKAQGSVAEFIFYRVSPPPSAWFRAPTGTPVESIKNLVETTQDIQVQENNGMVIFKVPMDNLVPVLQPTTHQLSIIDHLKQTLAPQATIASISETHITFALDKGIEPDYLLNIYNDLLSDPPLRRISNPKLVDVEIKDLASEFQPLRFRIGHDITAR